MPDTARINLTVTALKSSDSYEILHQRAKGLAVVKLTTFVVHIVRVVFQGASECRIANAGTQHVVLPGLLKFCILKSGKLSTGIPNARSIMHLTRQIDICGFRSSLQNQKMGG